MLNPQSFQKRQKRHCIYKKKQADHGFLGKTTILREKACCFMQWVRAIDDEKERLAIGAKYMRSLQEQTAIVKILDIGDCARRTYQGVAFEWE
jgi:transcription elongation factor